MLNIVINITFKCKDIRHIVGFAVKKSDTFGVDCLDLRFIVLIVK